MCPFSPPSAAGPEHSSALAAPGSAQPDTGTQKSPSVRSTAFERLIEENARLKERMQGIKSIGNHCTVDARPAAWGLVSGQPQLCILCFIRGPFYHGMWRD